MKSQFALAAVLVTGFTFCAWPQAQPGNDQAVPIYRVNVIERTVKAVDYQYRSGPTKIDFRGTVLLPSAKGDATVESKKGRTEIDAHFTRLEAPTRYGAEYLTYVLWAITPQGRAKNLGEVMANSSDHARLHVTTELQAFGMIVTAEPYAAVRQPSDVVVMENEVRPDTVGRIEEVSAKYELMPRGHYTYDVRGNLGAAPGPSVSMDDYEKTVELYQAQNAVQIAKAAEADRYAPDTFSKAEQLLRDAQTDQARKMDKSTVVTAARQAAQTAEDARALAERRKYDDELAQAREKAAQEQQLRIQAQAEAQAARAQASADRTQLDKQRAEQEQAVMPAPAVTPQETAPITEPMTAPAPAPAPAQTATTNGQSAALRMRLMRDLAPVLPTRDTPRGLVITIPDTGFRGTSLNPAEFASLQRMGAILAAHPGLYVRVEGYTDSTGRESHDQAFSFGRAAAVRDLLVVSGVPANSVWARGAGGTRPLVSNTSAAGREQNRRVEITISGSAIGSERY